MNKELAANTTISHYRIVSKIGEGGMGEVYLAQDTKLDRKVALKILPADVASNRDRMDRFVREAKSAAALNHPSIAHIYEIGESDGTHYIAMEFIEGDTLRHKIHTDKTPLAKLLKYLIQVAQGLSKAHVAGIVHRDLKPDNIMITRDDYAKVLDFGLAKLVEPERTFGGNESGSSEIATAVMQQPGWDSGHSTPGMVMGTVGYMSPEQASGRINEIDFRSDIFSFGCILFEAATGQRAFAGKDIIDSLHKIVHAPTPQLKDANPLAPADLQRIVRRCLAKAREKRYQSIKELAIELDDLQQELTGVTESVHSSYSPPATIASTSGMTRRDEGFRIAVLPFRVRDADPAVEVLADGLSEGIVTGLSRFSYLRVIARSSTPQIANQSGDVRAVGKELGARYVMDGSLRQAGTKVRLVVQLIDTASGAHLWAETYDRVFDPEAGFELQDDLVPRIVSTCGDRFGVLARSISDAIRGTEPDQLGPYEALMRGFGYHLRLTPVDHADAREALERAVHRAPSNADCWAMLSWIYSHEHAHGFNVRPGSLERALAAARRAVDIAPSNQLAQQALAVVLFFRKETAGCLSAAERAMALNPLDTSNEGIFLIAFTGDWQRGCAFIRRAMELNPHHPRWYELTLAINEYRLANYRGAIDEVAKANAPEVFWGNLVLAASYGQLGELPAARQALRDLLAQKPDFGQTAPDLLAKWMDPQLGEHLSEGLRKAGLDIPAPEQSEAAPLAAAPEAVAIAVLPFSDMSSTKDQEYMCEGMAEEIMNALVRIDGIRVASRTSAFRAQKDCGDLAAIARALSVGHVLEGSVRTAGDRLRVTAQLTDPVSGFQLWSERFDREAIDVFAIQDEIAAGVVDAVKARLGPSSQPVHTRPQAHSLEAYRSYLKGRHLRGKEDFTGAMRAFQDAVELDPAHAPSWTGLAEITILSAHMGLILPRAACTSARKALATALELQGESAEGLHVEAFAAFLERKWEVMEKAWRRSIELEPDYVLALGSFGITLCARQRLEEAMPLFERAREVDPLASFPYTIAGWGLVMCGKPEEALRNLEDALTFEKEDASAIGALCIANVALGRFEQAIEAGEHGVTVTHRAPFFLGLLGWSLAEAGRHSEARSVLEELRVRPAGSPTAVSEAWLLGALGEIDDAFDVLERAEEERQGLLCYTGLPGFDSLRNDTRFGALLVRLGLPHTLPTGALS